jgi:hypothetical protein
MNQALYAHMNNKRKRKKKEYKKNVCAHSWFSIEVQVFLTSTLCHSQCSGGNSSKLGCSPCVKTGLHPLMEERYFR